MQNKCRNTIKKIQKQKQTRKIKVQTNATTMLSKRGGKTTK